jgi:hypothetical protein
VASNEGGGAREGRAGARKAQTKLAEFDAIRAILDPYQRANPKLTVEEVIPLLLRDGRPEDAKQLQEFSAPKATS